MILVPIREMSRYTNPPVLHLKFEKPEPDENWEVLVPLMNQRYKISDEALNRALDLLFLIDHYGIEIATPEVK